MNFENVPENTSITSFRKYSSTFEKHNDTDDEREELQTNYEKDLSAVEFSMKTSFKGLSFFWYTSKVMDFMLPQDTQPDIAKTPKNQIISYSKGNSQWITEKTRPLTRIFNITSSPCLLDHHRLITNLFSVNKKLKTTENQLLKKLINFHSILMYISALKVLAYADCGLCFIFHPI